MNLTQFRFAFLCSRRVLSSNLIRIYDWATEVRDKGITVVSGFHSDIERDVFHFLAKGKQPIIMVLAKRSYKRIPKELKPLVDSGRLKIISPFSDDFWLASVDSAKKRNRYMIDMADEVVVGYASPGGNLEKLLREYDGTGKKIVYL